MFTANEHYEEWRKLKQLYNQGKIEQARSYLAELMPRFRTTWDDLRLLFYIGYYADEGAYDEALRYFTHWREAPPPRFAYRCSVFLYAIENSTPAHLRAEKTYLISRFVEATGFDPMTQTTSDDS